MSEGAVRIAGLTKVFGDKRALDGADMSVEEGQVFGFLGPNGAGKTTTLRILTGLARPTAGEARVFGHDVVAASSEVRAQIGFLPDVPGYYEWMDAREFLRFSGGLFGVTGRKLEQRVDSLLDLSGLSDVTTRIGGYSRGMKQRLGVAQALINAPRLLMLDEPTSALDPMGRKDVLEMIASLRGRTTVLFSTHILSDVERVCDTVGILNKGKVVRQAPIEELTRDVSGVGVVVEVEDGAERLARRLESAEWASDVRVEVRGVRFRPTDLGTARVRIAEVLAEEGLAVLALRDEETSLEDVFVELVGGG
jgi:ABC-2 type transport system ATP-binding protein